MNLLPSSSQQSSYLGTGEHQTLRLLFAETSVPSEQPSLLTPQQPDIVLSTGRTAIQTEHLGETLIFALSRTGELLQLLPTVQGSAHPDRAEWTPVRSRQDLTVRPTGSRPLHLTPAMTASLVPADPCWIMFAPDQLDDTPTGPFNAMYLKLSGRALLLALSWALFGRAGYDVLAFELLMFCAFMLALSYSDASHNRSLVCALAGILTTEVEKLRSGTSPAGS